MTFRNSSLPVETKRDYNLSFVKGADARFENTTAELVTLPDAVANSFLFFRNPFVSINTSNNTVSIVNSDIRSTIEASGTHQAFQFEDSTYSITNSNLQGDSLGVDSDSESTSHLFISGDSRVEIPEANSPHDASMPASIETVIDGGTVVLPKNATAENSQGQELHQFVSTGGADSVEVHGITNDYTYPVTNVSEDGNKHVWAPAVRVEYYDDADEENPFDTQILIAGTSVSETLNGIVDIVPAPTTGNGNFQIFAPDNIAGDDPMQWPVFRQEDSADMTATKVYEDIKVTYVVQQTDLMPIPDVETEDLEVNVGDTVGATDGLIDLPEGATVKPMWRAS